MQRFGISRQKYTSVDTSDSLPTFLSEKCIIFTEPVMGDLTKTEKQLSRQLNDDITGSSEKAEHPLIHSTYFNLIQDMIFFFTQAGTEDENAESADTIASRNKTMFGEYKSKKTFTDIPDIASYRKKDEELFKRCRILWDYDAIDTGYCRDFFELEEYKVNKYQGQDIDYERIIRIYESDIENKDFTETYLREIDNNIRNITEKQMTRETTPNNMLLANLEVHIYLYPPNNIDHDSNINDALNSLVKYNYDWILWQCYPKYIEEKNGIINKYNLTGEIKDITSHNKTLDRTEVINLRKHVMLLALFITTGNKFVEGAGDENKNNYVEFMKIKVPLESKICVEILFDKWKDGNLIKYDKAYMSKQMGANGLDGKGIIDHYKTTLIETYIKYNNVVYSPLFLLIKNVSVTNKNYFDSIKSNNPSIQSFLSITRFSVNFDKYFSILENKGDIISNIDNDAYYTYVTDPYNYCQQLIDNKNIMEKLSTELEAFKDTEVGNRPLFNSLLKNIKPKVITYVKIRDGLTACNPRFLYYTHKSDLIEKSSKNDGTYFIKNSALSVLSNNVGSTEIEAKNDNEYENRPYDIAKNFGYFNKIFYNSSNETFGFNMDEATDSLLNNEDVFIIGYGASGAGKTTTLIKNYDNSPGSVMYMLDKMVRKVFNVRGREPTKLEKAIIDFNREKKAEEAGAKEEASIKGSITIMEIFYDNGIMQKYNGVPNDDSKTKYEFECIKDKDRIYWNIYSNNGETFARNGTTDDGITLRKKFYSWYEKFIGDPTEKNEDTIKKIISSMIKYERDTNGKSYQKIELNENENKIRIDNTSVDLSGTDNDVDIENYLKANLFQLNDLLVKFIEEKRQVNATTNNDKSSRSHVVAKITFGDGGPTLAIGDFAGVENILNTAFDGDSIATAIDTCADDVIKSTDTLAEFKKAFLGDSNYDKNVFLNKIFENIAKKIDGFSEIFKTSSIHIKGKEKTLAYPKLKVDNYNISDINDNITYINNAYNIKLDKCRPLGSVHGGGDGDDLSSYLSKTYMFVECLAIRNDSERNYDADMKGTDFLMEQIDGKLIFKNHDDIRTKMRKDYTGVKVKARDDNFVIFDKYYTFIFTISMGNPAKLKTIISQFIDAKNLIKNSTENEYEELFTTFFSQENGYQYVDFMNFINTICITNNDDDFKNNKDDPKMIEKIKYNPHFLTHENIGLFYKDNSPFAHQIRLSYDQNLWFHIFEGYTKIKTSKPELVRFLTDEFLQDGNKHPLKFDELLEKILIYNADNSIYEQVTIKNINSSNLTKVVNGFGVDNWNKLMETMAENWQRRFSVDLITTPAINQINNYSDNFRKHIEQGKNSKDFELSQLSGGAATSDPPSDPIKTQITISNAKYSISGKISNKIIDSIQFGTVISNALFERNTNENRFELTPDYRNALKKYNSYLISSYLENKIFEGPFKVSLVNVIRERCQYIHSEIVKRTAEGAFINSALNTLRKTMTNVLGMGGEFAPLVSSDCNNISCDPILGKCFSESNRLGQDDYIYKFLSDGNGKSSYTFCICLVINNTYRGNDGVSLTNNPIKVPYIDLSKIKEISNIEKNSHSTLNPIFGSNTETQTKIKALLVQLKVTTDVPSAEKYIKKYIDIQDVRKEIEEVFLKNALLLYGGGPPSGRKFNDSGPYKQNTVSKKLYADICKAYSHIKNPTIEKIDIEKHIIPDIEKLNSTSVLGTLDFTDECSKYNLEFNSCKLQNDHEIIKNILTDKHDDIQFLAPLKKKISAIKLNIDYGSVAIINAEEQGGDAEASSPILDNTIWMWDGGDIIYNNQAQAEAQAREKEAQQARAQAEADRVRAEAEEARKQREQEARVRAEADRVQADRVRAQREQEALAQAQEADRVQRVQEGEARAGDGWRQVNDSDGSYYYNSTTEQSSWWGEHFNAEYERYYYKNIKTGEEVWDDDPRLEEQQRWQEEQQRWQEEQQRWQEEQQRWQEGQQGQQGQPRVSVADASTKANDLRQRGKFRNSNEEEPWRHGGSKTRRLHKFCNLRSRSMKKRKKKKRRYVR